MSPLRSTVTLPAVVVGLATFLVVLILGPGLPVAVVTGAIAAAAFARVVSGRAVGVVRRSLNARPAHVGEFPRLHNTVGGLCLTHGIDRPELSPEGNAAAMAGREGASMVLTTGAADRLGLVELEALVAHLLVRCGEDGLAADTTRASMGRLAGPRLVATADAGPDRLMQVDFDGADLTRFPPGMQTALQALADLGTEVDAPRATSGLWLLQPDGRTDVRTTSHPTVEVRIAALGEC